MYSAFHNQSPPRDIDAFSPSLLDSRIHHIIFNVPSQSVVAEWLRTLEYLYAQAGYRPVLTLTDARRSVMPPLAYVSHLNQMLTAEHLRRIRTKNAILHRNCPLPPAAREVVETLFRKSAHRVRFFAPDEKMAALRWLLSDD